MRFCAKTLVAVAVAAASSVGYGADLLTVYQQALLSDPGLKANQATSQVASANVGVAVGSILPTALLTGGTEVASTNQQGYNSSYVQAQFTQPIFDVPAWSNVGVANQSANAANATYQSQLQQFILTVTSDYFTICQDQDNVALDQANVAFLKETLDQTQRQFNVGVSTITDVKQAEAQYDTAEATLIQDQNALAISHQNLETLTGKPYPDLSALSENYPFVAPKPADINYWVQQAIGHNWGLQAAHYNTASQYRNVLLKVGGQLPLVSFQATHYVNHNSAAAPAGETANNVRDTTVALTMTWNLFQGGGLAESTLQASDQYEAQEAVQDGTYRNLVSQTRQDYLAVMEQVSLVQAYQQSVIAGEASLKQYEAEYKVGTQTIVQVLNAVTTLYQAKQSLVEARYAYINAWLQLKLDAGQLSIDDVKDLNHYLAN